MSKQNTRTLSESDKTMLATYLRLTPENQNKVISYLEALKASQCSPSPSADSPR